jgi:hypothetical protein
MIASRTLARAVSASIGCWMLAACQLPDDSTDQVQKKAINGDKHTHSAFGSGGGGGGQGGNEGGSPCLPPLLAECWHCEDGFTVIDICDDPPPGGGDPGGGGGCHPCGCPGCPKGDNPDVLPPRNNTGLTNFAKAIGKPLPAGWSYVYDPSGEDWGTTRPPTVTIFEPTYADSLEHLKSTIIHENVHVAQCRGNNWRKEGNQAAAALNQLEAYDVQLDYITTIGAQNTPVAPQFRLPGINTLWEYVHLAQQRAIADLRRTPEGQAYYDIWNDPNKPDQWYKLKPEDKGPCR